jgi:hypothetical protein
VREAGAVRSALSARASRCTCEQAHVRAGARASRCTCEQVHVRAGARGGESNASHCEQSEHGEKSQTLRGENESNIARKVNIVSKVNFCEEE